MTTAVDVARSPRGPVLPLGRAFVHPLFDLMLIGGGLSLLMVLVLYATGYAGRGSLSPDLMLVIVMLANSSHFAASTVRLYSKPGSFRDLPVMTMVFPLLSVGVLTLGLVFSEAIGSNLYKLYLSWSPYHYAAQTYGLAAMYAVRSGCTLTSGQRKLMWWTCMLPFLYAFVQNSHAGLGWFLPPALFVDHPMLLEARDQALAVLRVLVFATPVALLVAVHRRSSVGLPFISFLLMFTNGIWWAAFDYLGAIVWATIFHGVQYLAIVIIFHLRDHPPHRTGRAAWLLPSLKFYAICLLLAYALFEVWPYFYTLAGFSFAESVLLCVAVINIHHFIVDGGIWRVRRDPGNRRLVEQ
jgi:hypothetical protein